MPAGTYPYSATVLPLRGTVPAGYTLRSTDDTAMRATVLSTHDDGSAAVVIVAGSSTHTANQTKTLTVQDDRGLERMKQLLSHGREWEARGRQELVALRKESQQLREQPHAEIEQAKVYMQEFEAMMTMEPEQLWQFISEARTNYPLMQAKAERAYAERLMDQARTANAPPEPPSPMMVVMMGTCSCAISKILRPMASD